MKKPLPLFIVCAAVVAASPLAVLAQSIPAGVGTAPNVGFELPNLGGTFSYDLGAAELISTGLYGNGTNYTTNFNGDLSYYTRSESHPFSATYAGGVLLANSGQPTTFYQDLTLSQGFITRNWNFNIEDSVSYLPESPVGGFSGVPGVGDVGVEPIPVGPQSGIGILTTYGPRISNTISGSVGRKITGRLSAQGTAYQTVQDFLGDNASDALDNHGEGGSGGLSYRISGRDAVNANYNYSTFSYADSPFSFSVQGVTIGYTRQVSRPLAVDFYVGPQHIDANQQAGISGSNQISAGASAVYTGKLANYSLTFSRGVNNGSGVTLGSFSDNVVASASRTFARVWNISGEVGWSKSTQLPSLNVYSYNSEAVTGGVQASRKFGRRFSGYVDYTLEHQDFSGTDAALNAFEGTYQVVGLGINYSPGIIPLGR